MEIRRIIKVGGSYAVTLPRDSMRFLGLNVGDAVQLYQEPDCVRIQPVVVVKPKLAGREENKEEGGDE